MTVSLERLARNQTIFREVNERLRELSNRNDQTEYQCECSDVACMDTIALDTAQYEAIRSKRKVFVIVPGHERLEVERVVDEDDRFMLVEKTMLADEIERLADSGNRPRPADGS
jgi:hypothetical protein